MPNNAFFKFFQDIVHSGAWKKLTPSARAIYPVLAIHTDGEFKPVYPSLKRLKKLSGLGNSGIASAFQSLEECGLIKIWSGRHKEGNLPNVYEFRFEYPGSQVTLVPRRDKATPGMGLGHAPFRGKASPGEGRPLVPLQDELDPPRGTNKRKETRVRSETRSTTTTIQGDVHINIDRRTNDPAVVDALKQFFSENLAQQLAREHAPEYIQEKIEITRYHQEQGKVRDPAAFLRRALDQDYSKPAGFATSAERAERETQQHQVQEIMRQIQKGECSIARHKTTGQVHLVDVPSDLAYIILQGRGGSRCIAAWEDVQHYSFE